MIKKTISIQELIMQDYSMTAEHWMESNQEDYFIALLVRKHKSYSKLIGKDKANAYVKEFMKHVDFPLDNLDYLMENREDDEYLKEYLYIKAILIA